MAYKSDIIDKRTCVYRAYLEGELAYVGVTCNTAGRFARHAVQKSWWRDVERVEVEWFANREDALAAERAAIIDEEPVFNIARPVVR